MVVLYGCQGADTDAEQFALTDKLFDAALGELSVPEGSPACWLEILTWSPPKSLVCEKEYRLGSGLIWKLLGLWLLVSSLLLPVNVLGVPVVVIVVISWLVALLLLLLCYLARFRLTGGLPLILLSGLFLTMVGGPAR